MKDIKAIRGQKYIYDLISQGEHEHQDFKYSVSDARKIARSISAFANNDGGRLLIGIKDNGGVRGVQNEEDIYVVEQAARKYCEPSQEVDFAAFKVDGRTVIQANVKKAARRPVSVDEGGGVRAAYYRVNDENIVAHKLMVRAWQMESSQKGTEVLNFGDDVSLRILQALENGAMSVGRLALQVHASLTTVEDVVTRLTAMGLIVFKFNGTVFEPALP